MQKSQPKPCSSHNTSVAKINSMGLDMGQTDVWPAKEADDLVFQLIRG